MTTSPVPRGCPAQTFLPPDGLLLLQLHGDLLLLLRLVAVVLEMVNRNGLHLRLYLLLRCCCCRETWLRPRGAPAQWGPVAVWKGLRRRVCLEDGHRPLGRYRSGRRGENHQMGLPWAGGSAFEEEGSGAAAVVHRYRVGGEAKGLEGRGRRWGRWGRKESQAHIQMGRLLLRFARLPLCSSPVFMLLLLWLLLEDRWRE